jgi:hypothetical protein
MRPFIASAATLAGSKCFRTPVLELTSKPARELIGQGECPQTIKLTWMDHRVHHHHQGSKPNDQAHRPPTWSRNTLHHRASHKERPPTGECKSIQNHSANIPLLSNHLLPKPRPAKSRTPPSSLFSVATPSAKLLILGQVRLEPTTSHDVNGQPFSQRLRTPRRHPERIPFRHSERSRRISPFATVLFIRARFLDKLGMTVVGAQNDGVPNPTRYAVNSLIRSPFSVRKIGACTGGTSAGASGGR